MLLSIRSMTVIAALVVGVSGTGAAQDPREITWLALEFPPFFIHDGDQAGMGIADQVTRVLRERMTDWRHRTRIADTAETVIRFRAGEQACTAAHLRTPQREQYMEFSIPDMLLPPNGITIRRRDLERFGGGGPVSLAALLGDSSLRLGIAQGRSYGEEIDAILQHHKQDRHLYSRLGRDIYETLFDMLMRDGVDYILGYPYEAAFHARRRGREEAIVSLSVRESPEMILAHVACPKTAWGRTAIAAIDEVLREVRPTAEYRGFVERWLGPELRRAYREAYETEFGVPADR